MNIITYACGVAFPTKDTVLTVRRDDLNAFLDNLHEDTDGDEEMIARLNEGHYRNMTNPPPEGERPSFKRIKPTYTILLDLTDHDTLKENNIHNMDEFLLMSTNNERRTLVNTLQFSLSEALRGQYSDHIYVQDITTSKNNKIRFYVGVIYNIKDWNTKNTSVPHSQRDSHESVGDLDFDDVQQRITAARIGDSRGAHVSRIADIDSDISPIDLAILNAAINQLSKLNHGTIAKNPERYVDFQQMDSASEEIDRANMSVTFKDGTLSIIYNKRLPLVRDVRSPAPKNMQTLILTNEDTKKAIMSKLGDSGIVTDIDQNNDFRNYILLTSDEAKTKLVTRVLRIGTLEVDDIYVQGVTDEMPEIKIKYDVEKFKDAPGGEKDMERIRNMPKEGKTHPSLLEKADDKVSVISYNNMAEARKKEKIMDASKEDGSSSRKTQDTHGKTSKFKLR